jgi:hypothetical protein
LQVRSVFVFPSCDEASVVALLNRLSPLRSRPWLVGDCLYVDLASTSDGVYQDWEPEDVQALTQAVGSRPQWAVIIDISRRIDGTSELRGLVLMLLAEGGVAMDDYSNHPWTREEIATNLDVLGLHFFDYKTHYLRLRDSSPPR